ncbi:hypothetical protein [Caenimonas koreensis]|uniref:hypothetical protein n=1 Tax=Caenimonas koreensis TaxID=367474 RepID=UPI0037851E79
MTRSLEPLTHPVGALTLTMTWPWKAGECLVQIETVDQLFQPARSREWRGWKRLIQLDDLRSQSRRNTSTHASTATERRVMN